MQHCKTGDQARRQRGGEGVKVKIKVNADLYSALSCTGAQVHVYGRRS